MTRCNRCNCCHCECHAPAAESWWDSPFVGLKIMFAGMAYMVLLGFLISIGIPAGVTLTVTGAVVAAVVIRAHYKKS